MAADILGEIVGVFRDMWANIVTGFTQSIGSIVVALVLVLFGIVLALVAKRIVKAILQSTKIDRWIDEQNLTAAIGGKEISGLAASLTKWYIIGLFLSQAVAELKLQIFQDYLYMLFVSGPDGRMPVFFAVLSGFVFVVAGLLVARYIRNWIEASSFRLKKPVAVVVEGIVLLFAIINAVGLVLGSEIAQSNIQLLRMFIEPVVWSFSIMLAVVVGITLLVNSKAELKKISEELKKTIK